MLTLFIDLASHASAPLSTGPTEHGQGACMACVSDDKTEAIRFIDHRIGDDGLMPVFDQVVKEAGWTEKDLTQIACVTGPGGFTSLRMAVALANALADQLQVPSCGIHLSDVYEARAKKQETRLRLRATDGQARSKKQRSAQSSKLKTQNFFWIHATKKEALFIKGFGDYAGQWPEPTLVTLDELVQQLPDKASVAGEILPEQRERLASKTMIDIPLRSMEDALPGLLLARQYDQSLLMPWYGRGW